MKRTSIFSLLLALSVLAWPAAAQDDEDLYGDEYRTGDYGRIRYEENGVTILRAEAERSAGDRPEEATVNAPVFPGDAIVTGRNQRVEVELAGGTLVRVDTDTEVVFLSLPSPYASFRDNTVLQLVEGVVRISARVSEDQEFRIDTPASSVYLLGDGDFRVEADRQGRSLISSWRGVAEVASGGGSVLVRGGMRTEVSPGAVPYEPESFNTFASDGFDRWTARREEQVRVRDHYGYSGYDTGGYEAEPEVYDALPYEVRPYYGELSRSGRWVWVDGYGWCWYPRGVASGWRPYHDGYWAYGPRGYFWVSYEPWGWAPYHYGRWSWLSGYGWCWVPGRVFAGAWVAWSWGSLHVGWSPLDYWGRPAYYGRVYYGHYDPHCWTFVSYHHLHHRHVRHISIGVHDVGDDLGRHAIVTRAPRVGPRELADNPAARTRATLEVRERARARLASVEGERTPARRFTEMDERIAARARRDRTAGDRGRDMRDVRDEGRTRMVRPAPERQPRPGVPDRPIGRIGAGRPDDAADRARPGNVTAPHPRRIQPDAGDVRRGVPRPVGDRSPAASPPERPSERPEARTPRPRVTPEREDVQERRRELYRRMERPTETRTRERAEPAAPRRDEGDNRSVRPERPSYRPVPSRTEARPQPVPRRTPPPTVREHRSSPPAPRARPSAPRPAPRPESARPSPSRGSSRPQAAPSRGGGARPQPKAQPSKKSGGESKSKGRSARRKD